MVNKYCFITPRQVGKSTRAIYEFLKDPKNTLFICHSNSSAGYIKDKLPLEYHNNVISQNKQYIYFKDKQRVIMDEFLFFNPKSLKKIHIEMKLNNIKEYYLYSTPLKLYDKRLIEFVKYKKEEKGFIYEKELIEEYFGFSSTNDSYITIKYKEFLEDFDFLYFNPITDPDCKWVELYLKYPKPEEYCHNILYKDMEVLGKLVKEPKYFVASERFEENLDDIIVKISKKLHE